MPVVKTTYKYEEGISYLYTATLTSGISGKIIEDNGEQLNYLITKDGKVYNITTEREVKSFIDKGYYRIILSTNEHKSDDSDYKCRHFRIHRLIAYAYIPNLNNLPYINHIDGNKGNNDIQNLEWVTASENMKHAYDTKLHIPLCGESCVLSKYTLDDVERTCALLEAGFSPKVITEKTGLGEKFVRNLYNKETWKSITEDKNFTKVLLHSKFFDLMEVIQLEYLFSKGYSINEVIDKMNWEYNKLLKSRLRFFKKQCERYWEAKEKKENESHQMRSRINSFNCWKPELGNQQRSSCEGERSTTIESVA